MKIFLTFLMSIALLSCGGNGYDRGSRRYSDYDFRSDQECRDFFDNQIDCLRRLNSSMNIRQLEEDFRDWQDRNNRLGTYNSNYDDNYSSYRSRRNYNLQDQCYSERDGRDWIDCMQDEVRRERNRHCN